MMAVVTVIVLFVDFLMGSYGFSAMDVNCAWMHASCVDLESDVFLWDNVVCD